MAIADSENVGIAFALVCAAGASTALGASVVFFPSLVKLASRKTLAGGLGLSAGVMSYVSFVEIFQKSVGSFVDAGHDPEREAYVYATLCFFAGVVAMVLLNMLVHGLLGSHHHHAPPERNTQQESNTDNREDTIDVAPPCCDDHPADTLEQIQHMAEEMEHQEEMKNEGGADGAEVVEAKDDADAANPPTNDADGSEADDDNEVGATGMDKRESQKLSRMSLNTAVAIALHNFPEGLATFVATLNDPAVGAVLAIAIAIHNIPEGLCVAMPVYYATGNRWRAFGWAVLSGISEPIAAFFGWLVLANSFSDDLYAVLFGMVAGMMIIISVRELLPTAHRYDPEDTVVTNMFIVGMLIMALSLVLFML